MKTPTLTQIIRRDAAWCLRSGVDVDYSPAYGVVAILINGRTLAFLQDSQGSDFIDAAQCLYNKSRHVTMDECALHLARGYAECLEIE
jgi:hypothetical protein